MVRGDSESSMSNMSAKRCSTAGVWLAVVKALEQRRKRREKKGGGREEEERKGGEISISNLPQFKSLLMHRCKHKRHGLLNNLQEQLQLVLGYPESMVGA